MGRIWSRVPWEIKMRSAAPFAAGRDEAGRECHHRAEQVAIRHAESQRVRGSIRKTADGDLARVHTMLREDFGQGLVDQPHIRPVAGADRVPGTLLGGW